MKRILAAGSIAALAMIGFSANASAAPADAACFGQVLNVGSDSEVTINKLAEMAISLTGSKSDIKYIPYSEAYGEGFEDMQRRVPSLEKAARLIGYKPTRTLEDIINDVAGEMRENAARTQNA